MKIYTRTGDTGTSSLNDGYRTSKDSIIFSVVGEIDELSSRIGFLCSLPCDIGITPFLRKIQRQLHKFNAHLASPTKTEGKWIPELDSAQVTELEQEIDIMENKLQSLKNFILPGCYELDSQAHLCRTQTRRVERKLWKLINYSEHLNLIKNNENTEFIPCASQVINPIIPQYINRLSDFFFVLARWLCFIMNGIDIIV